MADFYLSPSGNDSGLGTYESPWATWDHVDEHVAPGDTVWHLNGIYYPTASETLNTDGPITYRAYPGAMPIFDLGGQDYVRRSNASYITFQELWFRNAGRYCLELVGDNVAGGHYLIDRCHFEGIDATGHEDLVKFLTNATDSEVKGSYFTKGCQNFLDSFASGLNVHHNTFFRSGYDGEGQPQAIIFKGGANTGSSLHHNWFQDCPPVGNYEDIYSCVIEIGGWSGSGRGTGYECDNCLVYDNVVCTSGASALHLIEVDTVLVCGNTFVVRQGRWGVVVMGNYATLPFHDHSCNVTVQNNVFVGGWMGAVYVEAKSALAIHNNSFDYNRYSRLGSGFEDFRVGGTMGGGDAGKIWYSFAGWRTLTGNDAHSQMADPGFESEGEYNFKPAAGSTLLDSGVTVVAVTDDYDGISRPQGSAYDIGAYELEVPAPPEPVPIPIPTGEPWIVWYSWGEPATDRWVIVTAYPGLVEFYFAYYSMSADLPADPWYTFPGYTGSPPQVLADGAEWVVSLADQPYYNGHYAAGGVFNGKTAYQRYVPVPPPPPPPPPPPEPWKPAMSFPTPDDRWFLNIPIPPSPRPPEPPRVIGTEGTPLMSGGGVQ